MPSIDANTGWKYWEALKKELVDRLIKPTRHSTFVMYFVFVLIIAGGMGVWLPYAISLLGEARPNPSIELSVAMNLATYLAAVTSAALADIVLAETSRTLRMLAFSVSIISVFCATLVFFTISAGWAFLFAVPGFLLSIFLWWIVNAREARLHEHPELPISAVGASEEQPIIGDTKGYAT